MDMKLSLVVCTFKSRPKRQKSHEYQLEAQEAPPREFLEIGPL